MNLIRLEENIFAFLHLYESDTAESIFIDYLRRFSDDIFSEDQLPLSNTMNTKI